MNAQTESLDLKDQTIAELRALVLLQRTTIDNQREQLAAVRAQLRAALARLEITEGANAGCPGRFPAHDSELSPQSSVLSATCANCGKPRAGHDVVAPHRCADANGFFLDTHFEPLPLIPQSSSFSPEASPLSPQSSVLSTPASSDDAIQPDAPEGDPVLDPAYEDFLKRRANAGRLSRASQPRDLQPA